MKTNRTQNRKIARSCGFDSLRRHHSFWFAFASSFYSANFSKLSMAPIIIHTFFRIFIERLVDAKGVELFRIKSSVFYWLSFSSVCGSMYLLSKSDERAYISVALSLLLLVAPSFAVYPLVRYLFGGRGGVLPAFVSAVTVEVSKYQLEKSLKNRKKK